MIDCDDYVSLSDDDTVVEVTPNPASERGNYIRSPHAIETIVIDEDIDQPSTDTSNKNHLNSVIETMKKIKKEHSTFAHFLDTCLDLENSDGMMRIIERTLIKLYEKCDGDYKKSPQFLSTLNKTISLLQTDPDHKFSHIKNLVVSMDAKQIKKRVDFVTLATNLKEKHTPELVSKSKQRKSKCINNNDSIVIDSDDEHPDIPTINLDDTPNEVICLDGLEAEKENHRTENNLSNSQDNYLLPQEEVLYESSQELTFVATKVVPIEYEPICDVPQSDLSENNKTLETILERVKNFESRIGYLKRQITVLEEMEVDNDSVTSPYVLCESYKAEVVGLYKEICNLIGEQPVKKRKVRLKVLEGHPLGPVKRLEMFINNNIGDDGLPMFPDYSEVLKCVMVANLEDNMGWKKQQVVKEANALFSQCGRALQQKRQKREYRSLLARLKTELRDPADDDPVLKRRLELNREAAVKKELDLFERYAQLQDLPQRSKSGSTFERLSPTTVQPSTSNQNGYHMTQIVRRTQIEQYEEPRFSSHAQEPEYTCNSNGDYKDIVIEPICDTNVQIEPTLNIEPEDTCNGNSGHKDKVMEPICDSNVQIEPTLNIEPEDTCNGNSDNKDIVMEPICDSNVQIEPTSNEPEYTCNGNGDHKDIVMEPICDSNVQIEPTSNVEPQYTCNGNSDHKDIVMEPICDSNVLQIEPTSNVEPEYTCNGNLSGGIHKDIVMEPICDSNVQIEPTSNKSNEPEYTCNGNTPDDNESCGDIDESNPSPCSDIILSDEDSNFEPPEVPLTLEIKKENLDSNAHENEKENIVKKEIKNEPVDIIKMLEDIGDDYTTSVVDIEDPFLVIEISDSSDSDDDEEL